MPHPTNLDQAVDYLLSLIFANEQHNTIMEPYHEHERGFIANLHHFVGMNMRNAWYLWWRADHTYEAWPKERPAIVKYFNDLGIYHADDMSGIIMTTLYRKYFFKPIELEAQIKKYQDHWAKHEVTMPPEGYLPK